MKQNVNMRKLGGRILLYLMVGVSVAHSYRQFFMNAPRPVQLSDSSMMMPHPTTPLSQHDMHIEKVSQEKRVDWRLTAAVISVESAFKQNARSHAGAVGLMQVMPIVFREQKSPVAYGAEDNIRVGLTHLTRLYERVRGDTEYDRLQMAFAAYNAGMGHLHDAQRLARQKGLNPRVWKDVAQVYPMLERAEHHRRATYGYCQGRGIVAYVNKVAKRYRDLQKIYPAQRAQLSLNAHVGAQASQS